MIAKERHCTWTLDMDYFFKIETLFVKRNICLILLLITTHTLTNRNDFIKQKTCRERNLGKFINNIRNIWCDAVKSWSWDRHWSGGRQRQPVRLSEAVWGPWWRGQFCHHLRTSPCLNIRVGCLDIRKFSHFICLAYKLSVRVPLILII